MVELDQTYECFLLGAFHFSPPQALAYTSLDTPPRFPVPWAVPTLLSPCQICSKTSSSQT